VGTGNIGTAQQGWSVSLSADGNTAIVGGESDNSYVGAAWVYTRSGGTWTQQGPKLVGTGSIGTSYQGASVSLSADGNTAIVGGYYDNTDQGAAWVYTRSGGVWTQQGAKLVGTGNTGVAYQGISVSLSADGNTAIVGGYGDNFDQGAAWVYTRSGGVWTQQGAKLVGTGNTGAALQGVSVSLSADGNTAIVGGNDDNSNQGAAWVYTRSGGIWTQQGSKLVGSGSIGTAQQGISVSLSADGNTSIVGGFNDNGTQGAAWVYTRSGGVWTQQGAKLVGTGNTGGAYQGISVSLSADGNTAIVGGFFDNNYQGAAWVYTRSGGVWTQQGAKLVGTGNIGTAYQGYSVSLSADGNTALVGGYVDNGYQGAAWVFISRPPVAPGNLVSCQVLPIFNINNTNNNTWVPVFDSLGNIAAQINANGNYLGTISTSLYAKTGTCRVDGSHRIYLNRNITITPQTQPSTAVSVRLYILKAELDSLKTALNDLGQPSGVASINDVDVFKNSDACATVGSISALPLSATTSTYNSDYYLQVSISSFSSFYFANKILAAILPVKISSFSGKHAGTVNILQWTASCNGQLSFSIERSEDGIHFEAIGNVPASGADCKQPFSFTDHDPLLTNNYYRLKINEAGTATGYSNIILLPVDKSGSIWISMVPDPVSGSTIHLQVSSAISGRIELLITDIAGRIMLHQDLSVQAGSNDVPVNATGLASGIYWLYGFGEAGRTNVVKFVKQ
jgi:hypothetical protein